MKRLTLILAVCGTLAPAAAFAQQTPRVKAKPTVKVEKPKYLVGDPNPVARELVMTVLVHKIVDGEVFLGEKHAPEVLKALTPMLIVATKEDDIDNGVIFKDRFYRSFNLSTGLTVEDLHRLEKSVGKEIKVKVREIAAGRLQFMSIIAT